MNKADKIYIAGNSGMVGSSLKARLTGEGYKNIITKKSSELDLTDQHAVDKFFKSEKPD